MNDELDKKLALILEDAQAYFNQQERYSAPMKLGEQSFIEQIKEAFIDEGWMKLDNLESSMRKYIKELGEGIKAEHKCLTREEWEAQAIADGWVQVSQVKSDLKSHNLVVFATEGQPVCRMERGCFVGLLSGKEWLDRFRKELFIDNQLTDDDEHLCPKDILAAAKKAAGISS